MERTALISTVRLESAGVVAALALMLVPAVVFAHNDIDPAVPQGLTATSGDGTMTLEWSIAGHAHGGYQFRYSANIGDFFGEPGPDWHEASTSDNDNDVTIPTDTSPDVPALTVETLYYFQVRAVGDPGKYSGPSPAFPISALQRALPNKLTGVTATAGNREVTLSWTAPPASDGVISYEYRQSAAGGSSSWGTWATFTSFSNTPVVTGLTSGTTYSFQVRAKNALGAGPDSETVSATPSGPPPAPDLRATPDDGEVRVFWANLKDDSIQKFQFRKKVSSATAWDPDWTDFVSSSAATTDTTVSGLTNGTKYIFEVRAINDQGNGAAGSVTATPQTGVTAPAQMIGVSHTVTGVTGGSGGKVEFTWDNPGIESIDKYQYRYDKASNNPGAGEWDQDWVNMPGGTNNNKDLTTFELTLLGKDALFFFELRAINTTPDPDLPGPAFAVVVSHLNTPGTSPESPAAPQNLTAVVTSGSIALSWDKPSGPVTRWERSEKIGSGSFDSWTEVMVTESGTAPDIKLNWTNTSLADGVAYAVEIRGVNDAGNGAVGSIGPVVPGMPNPPATLTVGEAAVEADRQTTLKLTWTAGQVITGVIVAGYQYGYRAGGATSWGAWTNIPGDGTTTMTEVADLSPGTTYEFQVRAMARNIPSDPSDSATGTTADPPAPAKPELVSATASIGGVVLAWKPLNDNTITVYRSRHTTTLTNDDPDFSEASWVACSNEASAMSCLVANDLLTIGTEHFFQIQAENPGGTSESYNSVSASPIPGSVPSVTLTSEQGSFSPVVDWEDVPGASSYEVQWADNPGFNDPTTRSTNASQYTFRLPDGDYYCRVRAVAVVAGIAGMSDWSNDVSFTVSASPIPGSVPSVTLTSEQGSFSPVVDWEDVPGASSYEVQWADNPGFNDPTTRSTNASQYTFRLPDGDYYCRVRAVAVVAGIAGMSDWSNDVSFTVSASPIPGSVPSVTLTSEQGSFSPVVDWEDVPGASSYEVQWADNPGFNDPTTRSTNASQYTFRLPDGDYYCRVRAVAVVAGIAGMSDWSNDVSFTVIPTFAEWVVLALAALMMGWWWHRLALATPCRPW